jgi:hypothetical protein
MRRHVARGEIQYSLCQRGIHSCCSAPQLHLVSDATTGALCAVVCEVSAVTHYQRRRVVESIDRVRLYTTGINKRVPFSNIEYIELAIYYYTNHSLLSIKPLVFQFG